MQDNDAGRIDGAFEVLQRALTPFVEEAMQAAFGKVWRQQARDGLHDPYLQQKAWDAQALLLIMSNNWHAAFHNRLGEAGRNLVNELLAFRRRPTPEDLPPADAYRALDTAARLLRAVGDEAQARALAREALAVMQRQWEEAPAPEATPAPPAEAPQDADRDEAEPENAEVADAPAEAAGAPSPSEPPVEAAEQPPAEDRSAGVRGWLGRLFAKPDAGQLSNLELRTRLLDDVERALKPHRALRPLPFTRLTVHVLAADSHRHLLYESAIDRLDPPFEQAVRDRLREAGFELRPELSITARLYKKAPQRMEETFEASGPVYVELKEKTARVTATITVVKGKAERERYRISSGDAVNIGRLRDVAEESYGHVVRRNHIAFLDHGAPEVSGEEGDLNMTVSRRHARIAFDARSGAFLLYNEEGSTSVSRDGYPRPVRLGRQPVPLQDGDLIYLGRACLRFETRRR